MPRWQAEIEHSRRTEQQAESLEVTGYQARWGQDVSLRLVMLHVILEYARHNGHADFLREGVDGPSAPDARHRGRAALPGPAAYPDAKRGGR